MSTEHKSWLDKISDVLMREPQDQEELLTLLRDAHERNLLDKDALTMIEGVFQVAQMQAGDIMVPKAQTIMIEESNKLKDIIPTITSSGHSRFPVMNKDHTEVMGILLAKELIAYATDSKKKFKLSDILRPAVFIPESKRLDVLLKDFRQNKNHMAIVADEHGGIAGLVTIEDVLEQIVGQIEDEFDPVEHKNNITIVNETTFLVKAQTPIEEINDYFQVSLDNKEMDTIGGLVLKEKGYLPTTGETVKISSFTLKVIRTDNRKLNLLELSVNPPRKV